MKKIILICITFLFCFTQCKKENIKINITLYNKPLTTIQSYIKGKWKCNYGKGGIDASNIQYYDNYYWTFSDDNKIIQSYNGIITSDTTITWIKSLGIYTSGDSTFIMSFYDKQYVPWNYVVKGIFNDTLIIYDNAFDAYYYHLTKSN